MCPLTKAVTYSAMHFAVAVTVAFALTRNWHAALAVGLIEPLVQTLAYTLHEQVWARFSLRRQASTSTPPLDGGSPASDAGPEDTATMAARSVRSPIA